MLNGEIDDLLINIIIVIIIIKKYNTGAQMNFIITKKRVLVALHLLCSSQHRLLINILCLYSYFCKLNWTRVNMWGRCHVPSQGFVITNSFHTIKVWYFTFFIYWSIILVFTLFKLLSFLNISIVSNANQFSVLSKWILLKFVLGSEKADLLALVLMFNCEFVTFPLASWVRCGAWLYRFLIFAFVLTFR